MRYVMVHLRCRTQVSTNIHPGTGNHSAHCSFGQGQALLRLSIPIVFAAMGKSCPGSVRTPL
jgi:hypothetical protein